METLLDKLGAGEASMYPCRFAGTLRNRCNAGVLRKLIGGLKAASVGSHYGQQARRQGGAGAGKAVENFRIGMVLKELLDSLVEVSDGFNDPM